MFNKQVNVIQTFKMAEPIKVWSTFSVTKDTGILKFKIVDLPQHRLEELADLMINHFVKEETTFRIVGVPEDEEALKECRETVLHLLGNGEYHVTVCCVDSDNDEIGDIIGASIMFILSTNDNVEAQSKTMKKLMELSDAMDSLYNVKKIHNLDKYYEDRGIVVHPDFRGYGMAQEFFKVRRLICKEHGVPMTGAWMTSYGSQKAAQRDGWEVAYKLDKEEMSKRFGVIYPADAPPQVIYMIAKI